MTPTTTTQPKPPEVALRMQFRAIVVSLGALSLVPLVVWVFARFDWWINAVHLAVTTAIVALTWLHVLRSHLLLRRCKIVHAVVQEIGPEEYSPLETWGQFKHWFLVRPQAMLDAMGRSYRPLNVAIGDGNFSVRWDYRKALPSIGDGIWIAIPEDGAPVFPLRDLIKLKD